MTGIHRLLQHLCRQAATHLALASLALLIAMASTAPGLANGTSGDKPVVTSLIFYLGQSSIPAAGEKTPDPRFDGLSIWSYRAEKPVRRGGGKADTDAWWAQGTEWGIAFPAGLDVRQNVSAPGSQPTALYGLSTLPDGQLLVSITLSQTDAASGFFTVAFVGPVSKGGKPATLSTFCRCGEVVGNNLRAWVPVGKMPQTTAPPAAKDPPAK